METTCTPHSISVLMVKHGTPPTMKDRKMLNEMLLKEKRNIDEENFDEAIAASFRACRKTEIPNDIQRILQDAKTKNLTKEVHLHFRKSVDLVFEFLDFGEMRR